VFVLLFVTVSPSSSLMLPARPDPRTAVPVRTDPSKALPPVVMIVFDEFPLMSLLDSQGEIDPREHLAFNPDLGSQPPGGALFITRTCRWLHKLVNQAPSRDLPTSSTAMPPSSRRSDLSCRGEAEVPFARQDF